MEVLMAGDDNATIEKPQATVFHMPRVLSRIPLMIHRVEIRTKEGLGDPHAAGVLAQIKELGIGAVTAVAHTRLFFLAGNLSEQDARRVAEELLIDPVVEDFGFRNSDFGV
jgi:phosphoribosylformylglycinamidine (FGAM) synthase PurS component